LQPVVQCQSLEAETADPITEERMSDPKTAALRDGDPPREVQQSQLQKVREHLCRLAKSVTKPHGLGFQVIRRDNDEGGIEYQIFADSARDGVQVAYVQSSRLDAEFIAACFAQAPLFAELMPSTLLTAAGQDQKVQGDHARMDSTRLRQQHIDAGKD
jgi:hypothetical protein